MSNSLITCEIDLELKGKQCGFLRIPHSVHRSAYGWIPVPIVVIKNGEGPTTLMTSGVHGDEYEGQIALTKLCRELNTNDIQGRLIILTMANFPAANAGKRTSPIDDGNLNRAFPGNPLGTPTEMIADYIENVLLPKCDYLFDFHSGGSSLKYPATFMRGLGHSLKEKAKLLELQEAFDAPYAWVFTSGGGRKTTSRTAMGAAGRKGAITVMAELGGGGTVDPEILALTQRGIKRMLKTIGMLPNYEKDNANGTHELQVAGSTYCYDGGLFEPFKTLTEQAEAGDIAGMIHLPDTPWKEPIAVQFQHSGLILAMRFPGKVERGDCLFQIAIELEDKYK